MHDIFASVARQRGEYSAHVHFNLIKHSQAIGPIARFEEFLKLLEEVLNSTFSHVQALPEHSSAPLVRFKPTSIGLGFVGLDLNEQAQVELLRARMLQRWENPLG